MTEVQLAIYDLSGGMARSLSASFLGPQHAVEIIPHTAILAFGMEYYFGQGIEWCAPHEFRTSRGIHPIELKSLGRTARTREEFEEWCRARARDGSFGSTSYDFFHRNCNNFSQEAATNGLDLRVGVPEYILDMPRKFLSSPMGMSLRPMLEGMQMSNRAPTNLTSSGAGGGVGMPLGNAFPPAPATAPAAPPAANPWANIPAAPLTQTTEPPQSTVMDAKPASNNKPKTPLLDKQAALLSTDTNVVSVCVQRLEPDPENAPLLRKLADEKTTWTSGEIDAVHRCLRSAMEEGSSGRQFKFALMLLRLAVLRRPSGDDGAERCQSVRLVAGMLLEDGGVSDAGARSMAWCVLSNAIGTAHPSEWDTADGGGGVLALDEAIDGALGDCDASGAVALRQSAAAFLYNAAWYLTTEENDNDRASDGSNNADLPEGAMSILLGCLESLQSETDVVATRRLYMAVGQLLKSERFGRTAASLVTELGLVDEEIGTGRGQVEVRDLAREVASLLG